MSNLFVGTITLPDTEPRHSVWGEVAGRTFDILSVEYNGIYVTVTYEGYFFTGTAYLDLGTYRMGLRRIVRDYAGMRGALMDRVPADGPLDPLTSLQIAARKIERLLRDQQDWHTAARLHTAVAAASDCLWSNPDSDIDLDLSGLDEMFTPLEFD